MKKIFLGIISIFCFYQSEAQVAFGIQGGLGLSRQNYELYSDYEGDNTPYEKDKRYIPVPIITGVVDISLSETVSLQPGFGFRQQGYSIIDFTTHYLFSYAGSFTHTILEARLNYLEMPVNTSIKLPIYKRKFEILTGLTFAACIGGKAEITSRSYTTGSTWTGNIYQIPVDITNVSQSQMHTTKFYPEYGFFSDKESQSSNYINKFNCSLNLGLGYKMNNHFIFNALVNYGLTNISPAISGEKSLPYQRGYVNTLSYSFTVAYMFVKNK